MMVCVPQMTILVCQVIVCISGRMINMAWRMVSIPEMPIFIAMRKSILQQI
jgi:hypothetical protein